MRFTKMERALQKKRAEKRVTAKTRRITQTRNHTRARRSIDRAAIFERDRGVCKLCKCDTERIAKWLANLPRRATLSGSAGARDRFVTSSMGAVLGRHHARALTLLGRLWRVRLPAGVRLFQVDHELPIIEGGSDDISNLRSLCLKCHTQETAALKGRLARRPSKSVGRGF